MSLLLRFSSLNISRASTGLPITTPLVKAPIHSIKRITPVSPDRFKNANFIEFCVRNENNPDLPPHLQLKYLPKSIIDRIERRKIDMSIKDKDERWSRMRAVIANLSSRIENINLHIDKFNKDKQSKANRRILKFKRKKLFRYVKRIDFPLYEELKEKYKLEEIDILIDKYTFHRRKTLVDAAKAEKKAKLKATQEAKGRI
ncbi:hypothetical protein LOD99_14695 [Oopsacas minuta]|uniref:28S ribosomal protein S15, mitochondrial n=1 Tax=Oopsacas minuta TaxID=111878 RepID=A0AAV7KEH1_9METZ|nr:hypothetical protein LOD99_14695 [Oopsacas minuta]